jgi:hypothetical protein
VRSSWIPRVLRLVTAAALTAVLGACSNLFGPEGGRAIKPELIRLAASGPSAGLSAALRGAATSPGGSYAWSSAIAIASFRSPIRGITLRGPDHSSQIYDCAADTNDACLVDLAGPALQDLLAAHPVTVQAGTYDHVEIYTCGSEGQYQAYLTGTVPIGGVSYQTKGDGVLATGGSAEPVRIQYSGCGRSYPLPKPLVVTDTAGAPIAFRLYFDIRDLAWASLGAAETAGGWLPGGCAGPRPGDPVTGGVATPFLCTGYPDVAGVVDSVPPVIERYRVNGGATIGLLFLANGGQFVGGFSRRFFEEGSAANPGFNADTPVDQWASNGDSTYRLSTFGGGGPGGAPVGHYLVMSAFQRASHSGTATAQDVNSFSYAAVRLE